jgi:lipopolysaccharide/colanic/teichoic acid biosynthesis glycosyltransferase
MNYKAIKRAGDILFALVGILIFLPFFIPLSIALLLTGEGYVFYLQERRGYKNKVFKIWKFATMLKASPGLGTGSITVRNDWRLTPMGKYLRGSKINEIPQLVNILKGDMSLVGPRPLMEADFVKFSDDVKARFYDCKPGLTGIASIVFRDEEKLHSESGIDPHEFDRLHLAPYKGALELWYRDHLSFRTDFLIIFLTAVVIIFPENQWAFRFFKDLPPKPSFWK